MGESTLHNYSFLFEKSFFFIIIYTTAQKKSVLCLGLMFVCFLTSTITSTLTDLVD